MKVSIKTPPRPFDADLWEWAEEKRASTRASGNGHSPSCRADSPFSGILLARIRAILGRHFGSGR